jgi:hypothetical protein
MIWPRRVLSGFGALAMLSCEPARARPREADDAAVYAALTAMWRVRSGQFLPVPGESYSAADSQLVASIEEPSAADAAADLAAFAAGIGLHYSPDTAFSPQIRMVRVDSLYHPWPAPLSNAGTQPRLLRQSQVVYVDRGRAALVYVSYSCCGFFGTESLVRLHYTPTRGWVVVRDEMRMIT